MSDNDQSMFEAQPVEGQTGAPNPARVETDGLSDQQLARLVERLASDPKLKRSLFQHTDAKIRQEMANANKVIAQQRAAGIEISPEQEERFKQRLITQAYSQEAPDEDEPGQRPQAARQRAATPQNQGNPNAINAFQQTAAEIFAEAGVQVNRNDPEAQMVDASSLLKFARTMQAAAEAKAKRMATTSQARMPTTAGSGTAASNALQQQYNDAVGKLRKGDLVGLQNLKIEFRRRGLKV